MSVRGAGDDAARTHITLLHTPQFHRPTHVRCRVTNVSRIRRSRDGSRPTAPGPRTFRRFAGPVPTSRHAPPEPCPATGHPSSPAAAQIGPPRSSHRPEQRPARSCARGTKQRRAGTRPAVGREGKARGPGAIRRKGKPDFLLLWPAHYCNFHTEFLRYNSSAVMRCKHL